MLTILPRKQEKTKPAKLSVQPSVRVLSMVFIWKRVFFRMGDKMLNMRMMLLGMKNKEKLFPKRASTPAAFFVAVKERRSRITFI